MNSTNKKSESPSPQAADESKLAQLVPPPTVQKLPARLRMTGFIFRHITWPVFALFALIILWWPIKGVLNSVSKLGYGSFYVELEKAARARGIAETTSDLKGLSHEQLHLFLVVGGESGDESRYMPPMGQARQLRIFQELSKRGLLENVKAYQPTDPDYPKIAGGANAISFSTTDKGRKIHSLVMDVIYEQLAKGR